MRTDNYKAGKTINYYDSSAALTKLKTQEDHAWLNEVSCVPVQQALRHLQTAYRNFFDKRTGYPAFKRKYGKQAAEYTKSAFKWDAENRNLTLSKVGRLDVHWSRPFKSSPTTVTISKDRAGRYFVTLMLVEKIATLPKTGQAVGIDLGINRLATLSTGERIPNPKHLSNRAKQLARAQRVLARRQKGSNRRAKQMLKVARIHARIADSRADYLNKVTTDLVRRFDVICMEDLNVRGMVRNHCLARSLSDASFGVFRSMIEYKCGWYGKELKLVDRFFPSSKRCSACGHVVESLPLDIRQWTCPECGASHDRDENAARNILLAAGGQPVKIARGAGARPRKATASRGIPRRSANRSKVGAECV
jgi:putative transposase